MREFDYRVHWGKLYHPSPDQIEFKDFGEDLAWLQEKIMSYRFAEIAENAEYKEG